MRTSRHGYVAWIGMVALLIAGVGCSSSSGGGGSCGSVAGCGGNVVGTWKITSSCTSGSQSSASTSCPGETISLDSSSDTGTITFNADGTYQSAIDISGTETFDFPASCVAMLGTSLTCAELATQLNSAGAMVGSNVMESFSCQGSGSCSCNASVNISAMATGTYTTSGAAFTTMPNGGAGGTGSYCVQGSTLSLSAGSSMMSSGMPAGNLVLTKQ